jgi:hypothetical protein
LASVSIFTVSFLGCGCSWAVADLNPAVRRSAVIENSKTVFFIF